MNRRNFLVGSAAVPFAPTAFGYSEEKPLGFDLPEPRNLEELKAAVDEVSKHFHRRFNGKMGPAQTFTYKENEYITFINGIPTCEGWDDHADQLLMNTPKKALYMFNWGIERYVSPNKQLVWRIWPQTTLHLAKIDKYGKEYSAGYKIRTRLVFE